MKYTYAIVTLSLFLIFFVFFYTTDVAAQGEHQNSSASMRIAIAGLSHDHVHGLLRQMDRKDFVIVGIWESDSDLAKRYSERYGFDMRIVYSSLETMLESVNPQAVLGFGSTFDHLKVVEHCAPKSIHVMVEKPLAVNMHHAKRIRELVDLHQIKLLVNYETTWYPSNHKVMEMISENAIGDLRKIVVHDGHEGPKEIGCSNDFLTWLTDPVLNGGGAITDFGCYGANLITWLMQGERPTKVMGALQQIKPEIYPDVDDEANIMLTYPNGVGIIQASWNWPFGRKDMEVYGHTGYIIADNRETLRVRLPGQKIETTEKIPIRKPLFNDPFTYFINVINGVIEMPPYDLSSLENNMIVVEILDAAKESSTKGKVVFLKN